jgi:hypothetical protein
MSQRRWAELIALPQCRRRFRRTTSRQHHQPRDISLVLPATWHNSDHRKTAKHLTLRTSSISPASLHDLGLAGMVPRRPLVRNFPPARHSSLISPSNTHQTRSSHNVVVLRTLARHTMQIQITTYYLRLQALHLHQLTHRHLALLRSTLQYYLRRIHRYRPT